MRSFLRTFEWHFWTYLWAVPVWIGWIMLFIDKYNSTQQPIPAVSLDTKPALLAQDAPSDAVLHELRLCNYKDSVVPKQLFNDGQFTWDAQGKMTAWVSHNSTTGYFVLPRHTTEVDTEAIGGTRIGTAEEAALNGTVVDVCWCCTTRVCYFKYTSQ